MNGVASIEAYYDALIAKKLGDFTGFNPRIEAAIATIAEWAPARPKRVLEIGCGIGAVSWRMARAWPDAQVVGADISHASVKVAQTCFQRSNLAYRAGTVAQTTGEGSFDLVVLMDVYEHIAPAERPAVHAAIRAALGEDARVVMTVPTPAMQAYLRREAPASVQPVDEDIDVGVALTFAAETGTELLQYRQTGIWRYGDYAHLVFGRARLAPVGARTQPTGRLAGARQRLKRLLGRADTGGERDYFGRHFADRSADERLRRFEVGAAERNRLAAAWPGAKPA